MGTQKEKQIMTTHLVYQAYGKKSVLDQTLYSILSAIPYIEKENLDVKIVIYTDNKPFFDKFLNGFKFVSYEELTPEKRKEWLGKINFVHRLKIGMLMDCCKKYKGHILYLDGDTYFTKSPSKIIERILPSISVMHICEDKLKPAKFSPTRKLYKFLYKNPIYVDNELLKFKDETQMWNAGVIGIHSDLTWIFDKIIKMTDELYSRYPKHIMEQFAVSYFLQKHTHIVASDDVIEHYWMQKEQYPALISAYLDSCSDYSSYQKSLNQFKLPPRIYKNPYSTFRMRVYQKVPALRPLISKINKMIESPSFE